MSLGDGGPDVVVLRKGTHGLSPDDYAAAIRERLPDLDVRRAHTPAEERDLLADAPIVTGSSLDRDAIASASNLRLFAAVSSGFGHLPLDAFADAGVAVTNASGVHAPNMAEHVLGFVLSHVRQLPEGWRRKERREWHHFRGGELAGSTVTVVGMGSIGEAVVQRLAGFEVETLGVRYTPEKGGPTDEVFGFDEIHDALARTDVLVLACRLTDETRGLIGQDELRTLPPTALLVNVARGGVVDTDALLGALRSNAIDGAALDVTDPEPLPEAHPLWTLDNVQITPHNSGFSPKLWDRLADLLARNVGRIRDSGYENLENQVVPRS